MKLEELQTLWHQLDVQLSQQKQLTSTLILQLAKNNYTQKIDKISFYEKSGAVICFLAAVFLLTQFNALDTWYLMVSGLFTILYLIGFPLLVLHSINAMKNIDIINSSYKDIIAAYGKRKIRFLRTQLIGIYLNFILMLVSLPVAMKVSKGIDIFLEHHPIIYWYVPIMTIFLVLFSRWGYTKYRQMANSAAKILEELNDNEINSD